MSSFKIVAADLPEKTQQVAKQAGYAEKRMCVNGMSFVL